MVVILGLIAEGGGDLTVVSDLLVDSVTIGSALDGEDNKNARLPPSIIEKTNKIDFIVSKLSLKELQ